MIEGLLEDGGLVHIRDVDGDDGLVFAGGVWVSRVVEVDGGVRGLDGEGVIPDVFIVQGLWWGGVEKGKIR